MRRWFIISALWLVAVGAATTCRVPWERPHPTDPNLSIILGYAPLWSHRFAQVYSAHPDGTHLIFSLVLALLLPVTLAVDSLMGSWLLKKAGVTSGDDPAGSSASGSFRKQAESSSGVFPFPASLRKAVPRAPASRQA